MRLESIVLIAFARTRLPQDAQGEFKAGSRTSHWSWGVSPANLSAKILNSSRGMLIRSAACTGALIWPSRFIVLLAQDKPHLNRERATLALSASLKVSDNCSKSPSTFSRRSVDVRWHIPSLLGPDGHESRGVVDPIAVFKDHKQSLPGMKQGSVQKLSWVT